MVTTFRFAAAALAAACLLVAAPALALDQIQNAYFARMFIVRPVDITALAEQARRRKLLMRVGGASPQYTPAGELDAVVDRLLGHDRS